MCIYRTNISSVFHLAVNGVIMQYHHPPIFSTSLTDISVRLDG